jgi:hypothetical protein
MTCKCCHSKKKSTWEREEELKREEASGVKALKMQRERETAIVDAKIAEAKSKHTTTCCGACFKKLCDCCHLLFRFIFFPLWLPLCIMYNICNTCGDNLRDCQDCMAYTTPRHPVHPAPPTPQKAPFCEKTHKRRYQRPPNIAKDVPIYTSDLVERERGLQPYEVQRGRKGKKTPPKPLGERTAENALLGKPPKTDLEHFDALVKLKKKEAAWKKTSLQHKKLPPIDDKALASVIRAGRRDVSLRAYRL